MTIRLLSVIHKLAQTIWNALLILVVVDNVFLAMVLIVVQILVFLTLIVLLILATMDNANHAQIQEITTVVEKLVHQIPCVSLTHVPM